MADPIGIIASTLHAAHRVYQLIEKIKEAPEEIRGLQTQAARVHTLLKCLHDDFGGDG